MIEGRVTMRKAAMLDAWNGEVVDGIPQINGGSINTDTVYYGAGAVAYRPPTVEDVEAHLFDKYPKLKEFLQGEG